MFDFILFKLIGNERLMKLFFKSFLYCFQDTSLNYTIIETGSGKEVDFDIPESTFQLTFDAKCSKSYEVQVNRQVIATVGKL